MGYSTKKQRPQRRGASNRAALEESKFFRKVNNELTETIESRIRENERLMAENASLKAQVEALKDYAHVFEQCASPALLCEYCEHRGIYLDGLREKAGMDS